MAPIVTISEQDMTKYFLSNTFLTQRLIKLIHPLLKVQKTSMQFSFKIIKKNHKKFLGIHNAIQAASKETRVIFGRSKGTGPKVLMFEPLPMPTKTKHNVSGEDKKKLSTCEKKPVN